MILIVSLLIIVLVILLYIKLAKVHSYWSDRGVKQRKQIFLLGDEAGHVLRMETIFDSTINVYKAFPNERYCGMYQMTLPALMIRDPELIKQITVKDFDHFVNHREFIVDGVDPVWSKNLFALKGDQWRQMRSTLSPCFTSSKMRMIFSLITECTDKYMNYFKKTNGTTTIELKDMFTRYTNDVIATVAFGVKCDSINDKENDFYAMGYKATTFTVWRGLMLFVFMISPRLGQFLGVKFFPDSVTDFFKHLVKDTIRIREEQGIIRPDMIHLLLEARKGKNKLEEDKPVNKENAQQENMEITDIDITAQALLFFSGGFESVSTMMYFMGYELTINTDVQARLQQEIDETMKECDGKLSSEALMKMKYMDMVTSETLRKWPSNIATDRVCSKPYSIEPQTPEEKPVHLQPGDAIWIPINAIHRDPKYWPNPDKFDPERFNDENKHNIKPYTYLAFGIGPRNCIGSRLALMEVKTIFCHLLHKYNFVVTEKTEIPVKISKTSLQLSAENGIWIGLEPRNN